MSVFLALLRLELTFGFVPKLGVVEVPEAWDLVSVVLLVEVDVPDVVLAVRVRYTMACVEKFLKNSEKIPPRRVDTLSVGALAIP